MESNLGKNFKPAQLLRSKFVVIGVILLVLTWLSGAIALDKRSVFLPGETSVGHVLFETSCNSCHESFKPITNETCTRCHQAELAEDAHGAKKFRDPRWAELRQNLDVMTCTACHEEHVHMFGRGVHIKPDLCMACHEGVIKGDLASHNGFAADGCWTAGCHNFHDHRSISTGFLRQNLDRPDMLPKPDLPKIAIETELTTPPQPDLDKEFLGVGS